MARYARWIMVVAIAFIVGIAPVIHFRQVYGHAKRLRVVEQGKLYRSGQLTAVGFAEAVERYGIRTIVNVQDDYPDPTLQKNFWSRDTVKESDWCARLGVRFVFIGPDLVPRKYVPDIRPTAIDQFLAVMDNPENYPVLLHCKAGLHRTGCLAAVYRMEYQDWTVGEAYRELKAHGFGDRYCTADNDYVKQYVLTYEPGHRIPQGLAQGSH